MEYMKKTSHLINQKKKEDKSIGQTKHSRMKVNQRQKK